MNLQAHSTRPPLVAAPGWATDARVFALSPFLGAVEASGEVASSSGRTAFARLLEGRGTPTALLGWSLGGLVAAEIARTRPELVLSLVLVGVRPRYPREETDAMREELLSDRRRCLRRFYQRCFATAHGDYRRFRDELMERYLCGQGEADLVDGLDFLADTELDARALRGKRVLFVHGSDDAVAPLEEARSLALAAGARLSVISEAGHAAFLSPAFGPILEEFASNG